MKSLPQELGAIAGITAIALLIWVAGTIAVKIMQERRKGEEIGSSAGLTFEERLAFVENKTIKLETNHIEHIAQDIREIKEDQSAIRERLAVVETKIAKL